MYQQTTATKKLLKLKKRIRGIAGGSSASKTVSILLILIQYAQTHDNELISVVSESFPHLKRGAMRDFLNIMQGHNYYEEKRWNRTDNIYTFETNSKIEFFSADQPGKVRGPRRQILFINEANNISYEIYTQLDIRTQKTVWLDWNPVAEFWWYTEVMPKQDVDFLILTYKDNEALDANQVDALEARRDSKNWWRVYGEGLLGESEGRIYIGWAIIDDIPTDVMFHHPLHEAKLMRYGLDFGYSNDPTAIVAIYLFNGGYIFDEICYQPRLKNREIADIFENIPKALIIADSAEPKSIDELKERKLNIIGSQKGQGSVLQGIQYVQDQRISVTKRSVNIIREYRNYLWLTDKEGKMINEPQGFLNHAMDAIRYGMDSFRPIQKKKPVMRDPGGVTPYYEGIA
jgi:phage terminase large subunit